MDIVTLLCVVLVAAILVGGWLFGKELDLRKPAPLPPAPQIPMSDAGRAITALERQLDRMQDEYDNNNDSDLLEEISRVNTTLASIATQPAGTMCKCGGKKL